MKFLTRLLIIPLALFLFQSCGDNNVTSPEDTFSQAPPPFDTTEAVDKTAGEEGLIVYTIQEGFGNFEVVTRDQIQVKFTGRTTDGQIFDTSFGTGRFDFTVFQNLTPFAAGSGLNQVSPLVEGFRRGILGMVEGEKRTIVVPPILGFSENRQGVNGINLQGETLIFDVELEAIIAP